MKIERETIKYEIGSFMISMKYYIAKRRRRYFISWDTSKAELMIYIFLQMKKRERETIQSEIGNFPILMKYYVAKRRRRYIISWDTSKIKKKDVYLFTYKWRLRETQSDMRLAISWHQWNIISSKEEDDISYHEIHQNHR